MSFERPNLRFEARKRVAALGANFAELLEAGERPLPLS